MHQGDALMHRGTADTITCMAMRKTPFAIGEWYHCYNRGVDKRSVFKNNHDYYRFMEQLYLANSISPLHRGNIREKKFSKILQTTREKPIVAIGAFCLMPNHYHLLLKEVVEGGITKFMQKFGTAYTMYFNEKNDRIGNLFVKPFRSKHVTGDRYFQYLINYIHCNPAELFEKKWKEGAVSDPDVLADKLIAYQYSSLNAYLDSNALVRKILDESIFKIAYNVPVRKMLREAQQYYLENLELP